MSRIGKLPVAIPPGVAVEIKGEEVNAKGPKGSSSFVLPKRVKIVIEGGQAKVERIGNDRVARANHGLTRTLLHNLVTGVSAGFTRKLEITGTGFKVEVSGRALNLQLGFSHPIRYTLPANINAAVDAKTNAITLTGNNKWELGQVAAIIRGLKPPEPYKGKGIRYAGEKIRRKVGKTA